MTDEDKALIIALELLRKSVADMTAAMVANATRAGAPDPYAIPPGGTPVDVPMAPTSDDPTGSVARPGGGSHRASLPTGKVADLPTDPGAVTRAIGGIKNGVVGALSGAGSMLAAKFTSMLGPTAMFGQVIQSAGSGFQVLGVAVKVLAATIAPILLPIVFALAVALTELSDTVWSKVKPILQGLYQIIAATILPVFRFLADVIGTLIGAVVSVVGGLVQAASWIKRQFTGSVEKTQALIDEENKFRARFGEGPTGAVTGKTAMTEMMGGADKKGDFDKLIAGISKGKAGDEVMKSLMMSLYPKAQTMGVSAAFSSAREKALNADPLEMKMLRTQMESLAMLKKSYDLAAKADGEYRE